MQTIYRFSIVFKGILRYNVNNIEFLTFTVTM